MFFIIVDVSAFGNAGNFAISNSQLETTDEMHRMSAGRPRAKDFNRTIGGSSLQQTSRASSHQGSKSLFHMLKKQARVNAFIRVLHLDDPTWIFIYIYLAVFWSRIVLVESFFACFWQFYFLTKTDHFTKVIVFP